MAQGIAEADGADLVLLTDADIVHDPRHLATLVAQAERGDLDLVSEMVALACDTPAEHALVPAFVFFFQLLYPFAWVNDPLRATAAAAGGTILIRRRALAAYRRHRGGAWRADRRCRTGGGGEARRSHLARPFRVWRARSAPIRRRPTSGAWSSRTAYVQLRFSPLLLLGTVLAMTLTFLVPPLAALFGHGTARWFGWLAWGAMAAAYQPTLHRFDRSVLWAPLPAGRRGVLSRCDDRLGGQPLSRPRRRLEGTRLSGRRRMSGAATVEAWSGKDRGDENFPVGSLLIRRDLRAHVHAFYAFARNADDIADSPDLAADEKIARLDVMEDVLLGRRDDGSPSALRLRASLAETGVTPRHSLDLLIAFRRDATKLRYADWDELLRLLPLFGDAGGTPCARPAWRGSRDLCAVGCACARRCRC